MDKHESFKKEELVLKLSINLKPYSSQKEKEMALNDFIMQRAKESMEQYHKFNSNIKAICYNNGGFRFGDFVSFHNSMALEKIEPRKSTEDNEIILQPSAKN